MIVGQDQSVFTRAQVGCITDGVIRVVDMDIGGYIRWKQLKTFVHPGDSPGQLSEDSDQRFGDMAGPEQYQFLLTPRVCFQ